MISQHTYTATVDVDEVPTTLTVLGGSVTIDEGWSPYVQADITVAAEGDVYIALDPRDDARVELTLTQMPGTGVTLNLGVRTRTRTPDGEVRLELASDEALAQDRAHLDGFMSGTYPTADALVDAYLSLIGFGLTGPYPSVTLDETTQYLYPGDVIWDALTPVLEQTALRLYVDPDRQWRMVSAPSNTNEVISLGDQPVLQEATDVVSRNEEWADSVVVRYSWTDAGGTQQTDTDIAVSGLAPSRTKVIEHPFAYPGAGAAQHILNRAQARGRTIESVAVSNYSVRPGMQLTLNPADGLLVGRVAAVTWSLNDDRMSITPRDLEKAHEYAWALLDPGESWADSAPGIPWTTP